MTLEDLLVSYNEVKPEELKDFEQKIPQFFQPIEIKSSSLNFNSPEITEQQNPLWYFSNYSGASVPGLTSNKTENAQTEIDTASVTNTETVPIINTTQKTEIQTDKPSIKKEVKKYSKNSKTDNISIAMNYFLNKGLTPEQSAGIIGNLIAESNLNPAAINQAEKKKGYKGYGRGIAQWSNERVNQFKQIIGKDIEKASLEEQLNFVWYELNRRKPLFNQLKNAKSVKESTDLILRGYENGSETAIVTPEQMQRTYERAYKKLGFKPYNFYSMLEDRITRSNKALKYYTN